MEGGEASERAGGDGSVEEGELSEREIKSRYERAKMNTDKVRGGAGGAGADGAQDGHGATGGGGGGGAQLAQ